MSNMFRTISNNDDNLKKVNNQCTNYYARKLMVGLVWHNATLIMMTTMTEMSATRY